MADNEKKSYLDSSLSREINRVLHEELKASKTTQAKFGESIGYLSQPSFNKLLKRKSIPTTQTIIEVFEEQFGYEFKLVKKEKPADPPPKTTPKV